MSSHTNRSMAHDFYYLGVDEDKTRGYRGCTVSYSRNVARSYATCVAKVIPRKGLRQKDVRTSRPSTGLTLVSFDAMTSTTSRHLGYLCGASPFDVVPVPMRYGSSDFGPSDLARRFHEQLEYYAGGLNKAENRRTFARLIGMLVQVRDRACEEWANPLRAAKFRKFLKLDVAKEAEELKARGRKHAAKRAAETRKLFERYVKDRTGADYCEFVRALADRWYQSERYPFTDEQKDRLRKKLFEKGDRWSGPAYVWPAGDFVETSKGVRIQMQEARIALKAWAAGKDMRAAKIGMYSVVSYQGNTIQIGCHRIPRENMLALYEAVIGEPFPERKA